MSSPFRIGLSAFKMSRLRFPKVARLSRASDFARLRREGISFHGKLVVLSILKTGPGTRTQIGLITSRRVGSAVARNRVRRRLREIVRALQPVIEAGVQLVLIARAAAARAEFATLRDDVLTLLRRGAILLPT